MKLCEACSRLDTQILAYPLFPCRNALPCEGHPHPRVGVGYHFALGSVEEVKHRRSTCDMCKLIAEKLDTEPSDLAGKCRLIETEKYCSLAPLGNVETRDPTITHVHLTQAAVMFDPPTSEQFRGPLLPWENKKNESRYLLQLQTKARSCPGDSTLISPKSEQDLLDMVGGRYVGVELNLQLVRSWIYDCEHEHGKECMPHTQLLAEQYKEPMFMVDVIDSCLVDTPSRCRYVALSYVWGKTAVFTHLVENSRDLWKMGSLRLLPIPATIMDAITLVRAIGERYLWVDSLCIIQDDLRMQQTEIMRMGSIYSHALFTIIATAGDHADHGLPGVDQRSREQTQKSLKLDNCELLTVIDDGNTASGINRTTWGQRAWTFQERALSNRVLVFSKGQVYWKCRVASHSEERALERARILGRRLHLPFTDTSSDDSLSWKSLQPLEYRDLYYDLLYVYWQRRMTYQTDILNAFNGVTEMLAGLQNDIFFWGIPGSFFSHALVWELAGRSSRNYVKVPIFRSDDSVEMVPIPSWSWAAWSGQDALLLSNLGDGRSEIVHSLIEFNIVDGNHQLIRIKEYPGQDHLLRNSIRRQDTPPHRPLYSHLQTGQLHFWTYLATIKVTRSWDVGMSGILYEFFSPPDPVYLNTTTVHRSEVLYQDFIVIAGRHAEGLILLAVSWKDKVAYRAGTMVVTGAEWNSVENKQWRWITLG